MSTKWKAGAADHTAQITLACVRQSVAEAMALVESFCGQHKLTPRDRIALLLIVDELIANTLMHGRSAPAARIKLRLEKQADHVLIVYSDQGIPFDPLHDLPVDHTERTLVERLIGGIGWRLIRSYCQSIEYSRSNGENRVALVRRLHTPQSG